MWSLYISHQKAFYLIFVIKADLGLIKVALISCLTEGECLRVGFIRFKSFSRNLQC